MKKKTNLNSKIKSISNFKNIYLSISDLNTSFRTDIIISHILNVTIIEQYILQSF